MELAIVNLSGDLAHPDLLGLLHAYDPELEVELELVEAVDDDWFSQPDDVIAATDELPHRASRYGILGEALRLLVRRRRHER